MPKVDRSDLAGGAIMIAVGAYFAVGALDYRMGSLARMGPGFVPFSLGLIAIGLGLAIALAALGREGHLPTIKWRATLPVLASIAVFALLLPRAGLVPATIGSVAVSAVASPKARPLATLAVGVGVAVMIWISFIILLGRPIPVIRNPF